MTRDHEDEIVSRVRTTLLTVADATPIAPPSAGDLRQLAEVADTAPRAGDTAGATGIGDLTDPFDPPASADRVGVVDLPTPLRPGPTGPAGPAGRNGHGGGRAPRGRTLALAAAVLAVALAAAATWIVRPNEGDDRPAVQTEEEVGAPTLRLQAGWLPNAPRGADPQFDPEPQVTATHGLDVDIDAAVYRREGGDGTLVMAAGEMPDAATADAVAAALTRVTRADEAGDHGANGDLRPGGQGLASVAWGDVTGDQSAPITGEVLDGARPGDVTAPGWTTTPLPVGWVPGIAPSVTTRYLDRNDPTLGPWVELAVTPGVLPEPEVLDALLPNNRQVEIDGRTAWLSRPRSPSGTGDPLGDRSVVLVLWQEGDGVIGSAMAYDVSDDNVQRIVGEADTVEGPGPPPVVQPRVVADDTTTDGTAFTVETWEDSWRGVTNGPSVRCWRVRFPTDTEAAVPVCGGYWTFQRARETDGQVVTGVFVPADVAEVRVDEGALAAWSLIPRVMGDDPASEHLVVAFASEADAHDAVVSFLDAGGNVVGSPMEVLPE